MRVHWLAVAALIAASPAAAQEVARFSVGGVGFELELPKGFCLPTGHAAEIAASRARADALDVTNLTVIACAGEPFATDYFTIKTAAVYADFDISRERLLKLVAPETAQALTGGMNRGAVDRRNALFGSRQNIRAEMDGAIVTLGMDDFCVQMGGIVTLRGKDGAFVGMLGGCVTAIGGRHIIVHSVGRGYKPDDLARQVRFAREIAERIRPTP